MAALPLVKEGAGVRRRCSGRDGAVPVWEQATRRTREGWGRYRCGRKPRAAPPVWEQVGVGEPCSVCGAAGGRGGDQEWMGGD